MNKKSFCAVPWTDLSVIPTGHYSMCCVQKQSEDKNKISMNLPVEQHWNSEYMRGIRKEISKGILPSACEGCFLNQSVDLEYRRERMNQRYLGDKDPSLDHPKVQELLKKTNTNGTYPMNIKGVEIGGDDTCQLRCITCSPSYSRSIIKDYERLGWPYERKNRLPTRKDESASLDTMFKNLKPLIKDLEYIKFVGGEPSISKPLLKFMDWCIEHKHADNLVVICNTNGAGKLEPFVEKLKLFKRALIGVSTDGIGELEEWMRYPTNWGRKEKNAKYILKELPDAFIHSVLCTINAHKLGDLLEWCTFNQYPFYIERLNWPEELSICSFPQEVKNSLCKYFDYLIEKYGSTSYTHPSRMLTSGNLSDFLQKTKTFVANSQNNDTNWKLCVDTITSYNKIRKTKLGNINQFYNFL